MYVSLPLEGPPRRDDLFAKTIKTADTLERRAPHGVVVEEMPRRASGSWRALEHLEAELFGNPRHATPVPSVERIEILGASRQQGEIEQIGRRIKGLFSEGDEDAGKGEGARRAVRPGEIVVVFRSLAGVAPTVREVFDELGIPFDIETRETLDETPLAATVVALLRLAVEDWPFRQLLAVLGNSYVQPTWPESPDRRSALAAERAVRSLQLPSARKHSLTRFAVAASGSHRRPSPCRSNQTSMTNRTPRRGSGRIRPTPRPPCHSSRGSARRSRHCPQRPVKRLGPNRCRNWPTISACSA